jgi:signal transduction histidine kinase
VGQPSLLDILAATEPIVIATVAVSELCQDLVASAVTGTRAADLALTPIHVAAAAAAEGMSSTERPRVVGAIVTPVAGRDLATDVATLRRLWPNLLAIIVVARRGEPLPDVCLPGGGDLPAIREPRPGWENYSEFLADIRPHLLSLAFRLRSLGNVAAAMQLMQLSSSSGDLRRASQTLLAQLASSFDVDVRLVEDVAGEAPSNVSAVPSGDHAFLEYVSDVALADFLFSEARREEALLASLGRDDEKPLSASGNIRPFKGQFHERRPLWTSLAHLRDGAVVCALGVAPRRSCTEAEMMPALQTFSSFFSAWCASDEAVLRALDVERQLASAAKAAEARQQAIHQMVCGIAHEVNTPLGVIVMAAGLIQGALPADGADTGDLGEACGLILANSRRLAQLVDRFKMLSVTQLAESATPIDIAAAIDEAVERHRAKGAITVSKVIDVDAGCEKWLGYRNQLAQLLDNLLSNAERHAYVGRGGPVEVRVRGRELDGEAHYTLSVADFGKGITPADLPRIFDPFFTTRHEEKHAGLGLSVVQSIVEDSLDGTVRCESEVGSGTTFHVEFSSLKPTKGA